MDKYISTQKIYHISFCEQKRYVGIVAVVSTPSENRRDFMLVGISTKNTSVFQPKIIM